MRSFERELDALKNRDIAPRFNLWLRIEDTLQKRQVWLTRCYRGLALAAVAAGALLVLNGQSYYSRYQLDNYLSQLFVYTPNPAAGEYGTFM